MTEKKQIQQLKKKVASLEEQLRFKEERLQQLLCERYGQKREKLKEDINDFLPWKEGDLVEDVEETPEVEEEVVQVERRSKKGQKESKGEFLKDLPVKEEIHDLQEHEKEGLVYIGDDITERLAVEPSRYYVKKIITKKYVAKSNPFAGVFTANKLKPIIQGSLFDESFYVYLMVSKYGDHLPLHRLVGILEREGLIGIKKQTLCKGLLTIADKIAPLHKRLKEVILTSNNCFIDETPVKKQAKEKCATSYFWILCGKGSGKLFNEPDHIKSPPLVYYEYFPNRKHENATTILGKDYSGKFHSDCFKAYEKIANDRDSSATWQPCWAHARRKFFEATTHPEFRKKIIKLFDDLFEKEREYWQQVSEGKLYFEVQRLKFRQDNCEPIANEIFSKIYTFITTAKYLHNEKIIKACNYLYSRKKYFNNFLKHVELRIDNNVAERNIRPTTIGRKNWLFVGSDRGGKAAAIIMSLIQTCKNLKINPRDYLEDILRKINNTKEENLDSLLPHNWKK